MIDHVSIAVTNLQQSILFYDALLVILGYERLRVSQEAALYGKESKPSFVLTFLGNITEPIAQARGLYIAFTAPSQDLVDTWYYTALEAGGKSNKMPGPSMGLGYYPHYYSASVFDLDGWKIEAVCHKPTTL